MKAYKKSCELKWSVKEGKTWVRDKDEDKEVKIIEMNVYQNG